MTVPSIEWRPILGFEDLYVVSRDGRVRRLAVEIVDRNGNAKVYPEGELAAAHGRVTLSGGGRRRVVAVKTLVTEVFRGGEAE